MGGKGRKLGKGVRYRRQRMERSKENVDKRGLNYRERFYESKSCKKKDNGKKGMERIKESHGRKGSEGKKGWIAGRDFITVRNIECQRAEGNKVL
jgi:hypothetical protein